MNTVLGVLAAAFVTVMSASLAPFSGFDGQWQGGGQINFDNGRDEQMRCKAAYEVQQGGNALRMQLVCASTSYKIDARGQAVHSGGTITGTFHENTNDVDGTIKGSASANTIAVELKAKDFIFGMRITTVGSCQDVTILPSQYTSNLIQFRMCRKK